MVFVGNDITVGIGNCVLAPSIIGVGGNNFTVSIKQGNDITKNVFTIEVGSTGVGQAADARSIVDETNAITLMNQIAIGIIDKSDTIIITITCKIVKDKREEPPSDGWLVVDF